MRPHIEMLLAEAKTAWPAFQVADAAFVSFLEQRLQQDGSLCIADLYVAFACGHVDPAAIAALEVNYFSRIADYVRPLAQLNVDAEEVRATLRDRLLPPPIGRTGRIAEYAGRGSLASWLRVAAVRTAIDLDRRGSTQQRREQWASAPMTGDVDPLKDVLSIRYRALMNESLSAALSVLTVRERHLLRLHFIDGVTLEAIGKVYGKNRSTVFRWLEAARKKILNASMDQIRAQAGLSNSELESLIRLLKSQLTLDLSVLLQSTGG